MINTILVSLAVAAGVVGLAGVPLRCWQFATGRFRSQIPQQRDPCRTRCFEVIQPGKAFVNSAAKRG